MIPPAFREALIALDKAYGPIFLVGGTIRDAWLGKTKIRTGHNPYDFDLIQPGRAAQAAASFCKKTGARLIALDEERKIFRAVLRFKTNKFHFDFADYQCKTLEEDLKRRDFTINALAIPIQRCFQKLAGKTLLDPTSGLGDLKQGIIRSPSEDTLVHDPIRLLRAFRFSAETDFRIEPQTLAWIAKHNAKIRRPAPERIRQELYRIFMAPKTATALRLMDKAGLLTQLFPVLERSRDLAPEYYRSGGVLGHALEAVACFEQSMAEISKRLSSIAGPLLKYIGDPISGGFPRYATLKLSVLLHDIAKPHTAKKIDGRLRFFGHDKKGASMFAKIGYRLRLSGEEIRLGASVIRSHLRPGNLSDQPIISDRAVYRFFRDLGGDGIGVLLMALADHQSYMTKPYRWNFKEPHLRTVRYLLEKYYHRQELIAPVKLITGHDIMKKLKIQPGPEVGRALEKIRSLQAEGKVKTKAEALAVLSTLKTVALAN